MQGSDTGSFLEEGYAELERGRYVSEVLEKPSGFSTKPLDIYYGPLYGELLRKYSYKISKGNGEEGIACPIGSLAAATLEILIQEDPALLSAFRKSRHSVEGLREVARRIDAVSPGLYQEMRQVYIYNNHGTDQALEVAAKVQDLSNKSRGI